MKTLIRFLTVVLAGIIIYYFVTKHTDRTLFTISFYSFLFLGVITGLILIIRNKKDNQKSINQIKPRDHEKDS